MKEKRSLLRVVRAEDGTAHVDLTGKANGRGAYICPDEQCLRRAVKSRALERALEVGISPEVSEMLAQEVKKRAEQLAADGGEPCD